MQGKYKIYDAFGNEKYICASFGNRNVYFFERQSLEVVKSVRTAEQILCITYNEQRYFQCCGTSGFRIFYDTHKNFYEEKADKQPHDINSAKSSCKYEFQFGLQAEDEIFTDIKQDGWLKIDEERTNFYKFTFEGDDGKVTPVRLKGLDFTRVRAIVPSPYFKEYENTHVAYMDHEGSVEVIEVELIEEEFNEGLRLCPFDPSTRLIDLFGAEDIDDIGQG